MAEPKPSEVERLREAIRRAGEWMMEHGDHAPECKKRTDRTRPAGNRTHPSYYGTRYLTNEEARRVPCTCGFDTLWTTLCEDAPTPEDAPTCACGHPESDHVDHGACRGTNEEIGWQCWCTEFLAAPSTGDAPTETEEP